MSDGAPAASVPECPKYGGKVCRPEAGALCECYPGKKPVFAANRCTWPKCDCIGGCPYHPNEPAVLTKQALEDAFRAIENAPRVEHRHIVSPKAARQGGWTLCVDCGRPVFCGGD